MENHRSYPIDLVRAAVLALCLTSAAQGETGAPAMHVVAMPFADVLSWYSENTGQTVIVPNGLSARVQDVRLTARTEDLVAWMARDFGLEFYRIGKTLYFSPTAESVRHMLPLNGVPLSELAEGVAAMDVQATNPLLPGNQEETAVLISGPVDYVALVETVLLDLQAERDRRGQIVVNRGGALSVDAPGSRRAIVAIEQTDAAAPAADIASDTPEN